MITTNTTTEPLELELYFYRTDLLFQKWCKNYNDTAARNAKLTGNPKRVFWQMVKYYSSIFKVGNKVGMSYIRKGQLPPLRTSNGALSKALGITKRTVMNARKRLNRAGLIFDKCWHGTNAPYEVWINPQVLYLRDKKNPVRNNPYSANKNFLFFSSIVKILPHTDTGLYPVQETIEVLNRKGVETSKNVDNFSLAAEDEVSTKGSIQGTNETSNKPSKKTSTTLAVTAKKNTTDFVAPAPPAEIQETIDEVLAHLPKNDAAKVKLLATICFSHAEATLYKDLNDPDKPGFLHKNQKTAGIKGLAEIIAWRSHPQYYDAFKKMIIETINIAHRYFSAKSGRKGAMLPQYYFDMRNDSKKSGGFIYAFTFYRNREKKRREERRDYLITQSVQKYLKSLEGSKGGSEKLHHELTQKIRKSYGAQYVFDFETRVEAAILVSS